MTPELARVYTGAAIHLLNLTYICLVLLYGLRGVLKNG